jgi:hypothetical protein
LDRRQRETEKLEDRKIEFGNMEGLEFEDWAERRFKDPNNRHASRDLADLDDDRYGGRPNPYDQGNAPNPPYPTSLFERLEASGTILNECRQVDRGIDDVEDVVRQEAAVATVEVQGQEVVVDKGNKEIGVAIRSARKALKWNWRCLTTCGSSSSLLTSPFSIFDTPLTQCLAVITVIITIVIILIYKFVIQGNGANKT